MNAVMVNQCNESTEIVWNSIGASRNDWDLRWNWTKKKKKKKKKKKEVKHKRHFRTRQALYSPCPIQCLVGPRLGLHFLPYAVNLAHLLEYLLEYLYSSAEIVLNMIKILFLQKFEVLLWFCVFIRYLEESECMLIFWMQNWALLRLTIC